MKMTLIVLILLISFSFLAEAFAEDVHIDPQFNRPILLALVGNDLLIAQAKNPCIDTCKTQQNSCKNICAGDNISCQKGCERNEDCINVCGATYYGGCVDGCVSEYRKCSQACPKGSDTWGNEHR
jgi:hypothetical protein